MKLTREFLQKKNIYEDRLLWFDHNFGQEADYQDVLNLLAKEEKISWADWLMNAVGPVDNVIEISGDTTIPGHIFAAGSIRCAASLVAKYSIKAGGGIKAGEGIEAGEDFGIYCGLRVKISMKREFAIVRANERPPNLVLGEYVGSTRW